MRALLGSLAALLVVLATEGVAVAGLVALGGQPWAALPGGLSAGALASWLGTTEAADALAAVLRLVALGCATWLLASTILAVLARITRVPAAVRAADLVTLPVVRRLAGRVVASSLSLTSMLGTAAPALAVPAAPTPAVLAAVAPPAVATVAVAARPTADPTPQPSPQPPHNGWAGGLPGPPPMPAWPGPATLPSTDGADVPERAGTADAERHVVVRGDNLWDLAASRLAAARSRPVAALSDREIHAYWVAVLAANREGLRSGDPDLIHPGEVLVLPPP